MDAVTPTDLIGMINQTLEYAYSSVMVTGEVSSFKVNQGKWVFFDLKDEESSVSCFMPVWDLRVPLEDGMKVVARAVPKLTKWGKFSLTVNAVKPVGEGSLKKAYEMLKKKLAGEGLFDPAKKRKLPEDLTRLGVISSCQAAGYADFIKIINARWGGMKVMVAHTQVQGMDAPDQIIRALKYFNERGNVQVIAILRGGGSADDLSCFNDERLVREIAASKIPVITGIGHEVDESLADLVADVRASTPSNAAEMLTPDRKQEMMKVKKNVQRMNQMTMQRIDQYQRENRERINGVLQNLLNRYVEPMLKANKDKVEDMRYQLNEKWRVTLSDLKQKVRLLDALNPEKMLSQGYAILAGKISPGELIEITTHDNKIKAEIKEIYERK